MKDTKKDAKIIQNCLYIKEIGVDICICGMQNGFDIRLKKCFDNEAQAAEYLSRKGYKRANNNRWYPMRRKSYSRRPKNNNERSNNGNNVPSPEMERMMANRYAAGATHVRDLIIANIIGMQNNMKPESEGYEALQRLLRHIAEHYGDFMRPFTKISP